MHYNLSELNKKSIELNFNRDTLEKVLRLSSLLDLFNKHPDLKNKYILKGGTAINLCIFDFPRLSVDIDLDFCINNSAPEMKETRDFHKKIIKDEVELLGYKILEKSRFSYTLDSYLLQYINLAGNKVNIKLELNYSNRVHVLSPEIYRPNSKIVKNK